MLEPEGKNVKRNKYPNKIIRRTKAGHALKMESTKKINQENQIDKSKQLLNKKKIIQSKIIHETTGGNGAQRICGNGKPMPSLSELEMMFESSDDEALPTSIICSKRFKTPLEYEPKLTEANVLPAITLHDLTTNVDNNDNTGNLPEPALLCKNGKLVKPMPSLLDLEKMFVNSDDDLVFNMDNIKTYETCIENNSQIPDTNVSNPIILKNATDRMHDMISNLPDPLLSETPSPPVIPHNNPKKRDLPYIVDCKDHPQITKKSKLMSFKVKNKYGIKDNIHIEQENDSKTRKNHSKIVNTSKSLFIAQSNVVSELSKEKEDLSDVSTDSNDTITYEYSMNSPKSRPFSPLPSTSNDNETILRNDQRFNESFVCENTLQNDNKVIEIPCETITIDDEVDYENLTKNNICTVNDSSVQLNDSDCVFIDDSNDDSAVKIVEPEQKSTVIMKSPNYYDPLNIDDTCDLTTNNDVQEIIDVDDVIAQNKNIIEKYCKNNNNESIILVEPSPLQNKRQQENTSVDNTFIEINDLVGNGYAKPNGNVTPSLSQNHKDTFEIIVSNFFRNGYESNTNNRQSCNHNISNITKTITIPLNWLSTLSCSIQERSNNSNNVHNPPTVNRIQNVLYEKVSIDSNIRKNLITSSTSGYNKRNNIVIQRETTSTHAKTLPLPSTETIVRNVGDCPICMENLSNKPIASTICGHIFCMSCIKASIKSTGRKCPTCRKALKGNGYHPLFL